MLTSVCQSLRPVWAIIPEPRAGSGIRAPCGLQVERADSLHFLAGWRKRWLNQALSIVPLSLDFFWAWSVLFTRATFCVALFCICLCSVSWLIWSGCRYTSASDQLERLAPKWLILCCWGRYTLLTHSLTHSPHNFRKERHIIRCMHVKLKHVTWSYDTDKQKGGDVANSSICTYYMKLMSVCEWVSEFVCYGKSRLLCGTPIADDTYSESGWFQKCIGT